MKFASQQKMLIFFSLLAVGFPTFAAEQFTDESMDELMQGFDEPAAAKPSAKAISIACVSEVATCAPASITMSLIVN